MDTSIIIPVHGDLHGLEATLESIRAQQWDPSRVEVIVCNDGGGEAVSALAARFGCIEARLDQNRGSYAARNAGIRVARSRAIAFIDADELVTPGWLAAGTSALDHADYVGGNVVVDAGKSPSFWKRVDATFAFPVAKYLQVSRFAPTANLFVSRSVFEQLGGFDEALTSGGDQEFGARVASHDFIQRYCEQAVVIHGARSFMDQLRKARRTSRGNARLQVMIRGRSAIHVGLKALVYALAKLSQATALFGAFLVAHIKTPDDASRLAAGHAVVGACYHMSLAFFSFTAFFRRGKVPSRIPAVTGRRFG